MAEKVTVKSGQTLSSIAKANNTTVAAIKEANFLVLNLLFLLLRLLLILIIQQEHLMKWVA
jgi:hypothetical protein